MSISVFDIFLIKWEIVKKKRSTSPIDFIKDKKAYFTTKFTLFKWIQLSLWIFECYNKLRAFYTWFPILKVISII